MADRIEDLAAAFARLPGIGPRQAKRFVFHLLSAPAAERSTLARLLGELGTDIKQCTLCMRFSPVNAQSLCTLCANTSRLPAQLMVVEKDQDLSAVERANAYKGHYFVLGGVLTLSGKGAIRDRDLIRVVEVRSKQGLKEIILALSATSEGEHTSDKVRELLRPLTDTGEIKLTELGRGLSTGSELEYADKETLASALLGRRPI